VGGMRVAIVHYWLLGMRGGERVVESLCRLLPEADIFTLFYDPSRTSGTIRAHKVTASYLNPLRRYYRSLLPLMPTALESFDLRPYDLVISSESGPAKGVLVSSAARHICYCHTPMRYLWELYPAYLNQWTRNPMARALMRPLSRHLRLWDYASAARVDRFIANSENVRGRIRRAYGRESDVAYPPVAVETFFNSPPENYFLAVAETASRLKCGILRTRPGVGVTRALRPLARIDRARRGGLRDQHGGGAGKRKTGHCSWARRRARDRPGRGRISV